MQVFILYINVYTVSFLLVSKNYINSSSTKNYADLNKSSMKYFQPDCINNRMVKFLRLLKYVINKNLTMRDRMKVVILIISKLSKINRN